jgi:hypothetical protein
MMDKFLQNNNKKENYFMKGMFWKNVLHIWRKMSYGGRGTKIVHCRYPWRNKEPLTKLSAFKVNGYGEIP